ncbi:MAG: hypothetical protein KJN90_02615 [Gammaproteobacteria bacterium]|nr:hypothetical protein [Gammaproteobacteria bacterium]
MKNYLLWLCYGCLWLVSGCTASVLSSPGKFQDDGLLVSRGVIENASPGEIVDVSVMHLPTRVVANVSAILPYTTAEMGIRPRQMQAESAILTWRERGQQYQVRLRLPTEPVASESGYVMVVYRLLSGGQAAVSLEPDSRGGL